MTMAPRYDDPSEYGGSDGGNYRTPAGAPRDLSTGERARLLRRAAMNPDSAPDGVTPEEYGERVG